jgi:hypothetical protein
MHKLLSTQSEAQAGTITSGRWMVKLFVSYAYLAECSNLRQAQEAQDVDGPLGGGALGALGNVLHAQCQGGHGYYMTRQDLWLQGACRSVWDIPVLACRTSLNMLPVVTACTGW